MRRETADNLLMPLSIATIMACNFGANHGMPLLGFFILLAVIAFSLPFSLMKWERILLTILTGFAGFIVDSILIAFSVYIPAGHSRWLIPAPFCPEWIVTLWLNYGFMVYTSWKKLADKFLFTAALGFVFSLLIISNASRIDLVKVSSPRLVSFLVVGLAWSMITISAIRIAPHWFKSRDGVQQ